MMKLFVILVITLVATVAIALRWIFQPRILNNWDQEMDCIQEESTGIIPPPPSS